MSFDEQPDSDLEDCYQEARKLVKEAGKLIAEREALKARLSEAEAQRDVALAEAERLRTVKLPTITDEIAEELGDSSLVERCPISTIPSLWTWTQDAVDFVAVLNQSRAAIAKAKGE